VEARRYRLKAETLVLTYKGNKGRVHTLPAGAEFVCGNLNHSPNTAPDRIVLILWKGKFAVMFQADLINKGEPMNLSAASLALAASR
jgi:hypothetical protein